MKEYRIATMFTGHMTDEAGRKSPRFPEGMCELAEDLIDEAFMRLLHTANHSMVFVCSLVRGSDIIAAEIALRHGVPVRAVLPWGVERFKELSVHGQTLSKALAWDARFEAIVREIGQKNIVILDAKNVDEGYTQTNEQILRIASGLGTDLVLLAFWDGADAAKPLPGGTGHFVNTVRSMRGTIEHVDAAAALSKFLARAATTK